LRHSSYPGIQEAFMVEKVNLSTSEKDSQYFITNRPSNTWDALTVLDRILLHWDTETGVFGIKDNTFLEDKARYFTLEGAHSHVALLNIAWNCFFSPVFDQYCRGESLGSKIQFWKNNPDYNPFSWN
jgi:hypothetical protein